jgi:2-keto-4-pentenoate hydratase/2-oxohepta-3-ene-1,7-dioic acid hydratase in catechol pathway
MKLCRFQYHNVVRTGCMVGDTIKPLDQLLPERASDSVCRDMRALLTAGPALLDEIRAGLADNRGDTIRLASVRLLAPIDNPSKIICAWVNYLNPAMAQLPETPIFFAKFDSAIIGPGDAIRLPKAGGDIVVEPEMTVVIGKAGREIAEADAMDHVGGYTIVNDVTAFSHRLQVLVGSIGPYMMAKTFDTFAPMGPWLTTADEIPEPHNLQVSQFLNGKLMTHANTREAVFKIPALISYLSNIFELRPGDLILTGSPPPQGKPTFLGAGDVVRIEIERLGVLENPVL